MEGGGLIRLQGLQSFVPMLDEGIEFFHMQDLFLLEFFVHSSDADIFLGIGRRLLQQGLIILNRILFAYEAFIEDIQSAPDTFDGFFLFCHLAIVVHFIEF